MKEASIAIVYASRFGHTKMQAEAIARGASANSAVTVKLYTAGEAIERIDELDHYDAIIFRFCDLHGEHGSGNEELY